MLQGEWKNTEAVGPRTLKVFNVMKLTFIISVIVFLVFVVSIAGWLFRPLINGEVDSMIFLREDGSSVAVSTSGVQFEAAPKRFVSEGLSEVAPFVTELYSRKTDFSSLMISSLDGERGLLLTNEQGAIGIGFTIEKQQEAEREERIRSFFEDLGVNPSEDYLARNGGVPDATQILHYPLAGDQEQVLEIVRRVLRELYDIRSEEGLDLQLSTPNEN